MAVVSLGRRPCTAWTILLLFLLQLTAPGAGAQSPPGPGAPAGAQSPTRPAAPTPAQSPTRPAAPTPAQSPPGPAASAGTPGTAPWPHQAIEGGSTYTIYQPQIESWDGTRLHARAAVSIETSASPIEHFGVAWFSARSEVDKANRLVGLADFRVDKVVFPSQADRAAEYQKVLERRLPREAASISLDRVQAALALTDARRGGAATPQPVRNDPPRIIVSTSPALLVLVDGPPTIRPIDGSSLRRIVNTWALILVDPANGKHVLRALGRWFEAVTLDGPWTPVAHPAPSLEVALHAVAKGQRVNLLDDPSPELKAAVAGGAVPTIYVSTVPAELVETRGRPDYEPIDGTDLLHVRNASVHIVLDPAGSQHYVLLSGRWFRSASLTEGSWEFVPHDKLPEAFAKIPESHPRGAVLSSVAGTPQAKEALIDNSIPQTAEVARTTSYQATYEGSPKFEPIQGTSLHYATNSVQPVIQVSPSSYYALKDGVWFTAVTATGPWSVATTVPPVIYTIPPTSPVHYVTYVQVYGSTPQTVHVGYTPGYYGTVVAPTGVVVYGTGYVYPPVYVGTYWYPPPPTYGFGAGFGWGAVTGFAFGAITAGVWGGAWGCCGYGDVDIDRTVNINRSDAYNRWSSGQVRSNVESRAQSLSPQQRQQAQQRIQSRSTGSGGERQLSSPSGTRANDVYAGRDGSTYRRGAEGWERNSGQGWDRAEGGQGRESVGDLNREQRARSVGAARESSFQQKGGGGSGYSSGGGGRTGGGGGARGGGGGRGGGGRRR